MSEQTPVEELIGWEWRCIEAGPPHAEWGWAKRNPAYEDPSRWVRPDMPPAEWIEAGDRAEVDDLLAHLRTDPVPGWMFRDVSAWRGWTSFERDTPSVAMVRDDRYDIHFHGPTILAALEAAVRAVHEQETTE